MKRYVIVLLTGLLALAAAPVAASSGTGVDFPDQVVAGDTMLRLRGAAVQRYRKVFKAYAAALYVAEGFESAAALDRAPMRLEIAYFWPIPAERFAEATTNGIARNVDADTLHGLAPRIARFNRLYRDVQADDRYTLTYLPGRGTALALNGRELGRIEGDDFASALFSIWLGDVPFDEKLKARLLAVSS
jgi:hypothetical protein